MIFLGLDEIEVFRSLFYWLSSLVYQLIKTLYDIFERLCNSRILDSEVLRIISGRIGLLLGIIMFFMVTFSVIQLMLEPDKLTDKEKGVGNIVKKVLLVIVMLSCSNIAFGAMYGLQKEIIDNNIIEKFILPYNVDEKYFGGILSMELFTSFYTLNSGVEDSTCTANYETLKNNIVYYNDFSVGKACLKTKVNDTYVMDFDVLLLPIVGGVAVWFLFSYCITVGVRTMQLAFLEIISPMAIISYLSPKKDTMFQKWWKHYFSTYIDVFIRIAIINLVVFLIAVIFSTDFQGTFLESVGIGEQKQDGDTLIIVLIVLALLTFAKKAPELLKTFFPEGESKLGFGAKTPKKMFSDMLFGNTIQKGVTWGAKAATAGVITGVGAAAVSGMSRYKINRDLLKGKEHALGKSLLGAAGGAMIGFGRGVLGGAKKGNVFGNFKQTMSKQAEADNKYETLREGGGTLVGMVGSKVSSVVGKTKAQVADRIIGNIKALSDYYSEMKKFSNDLGCVKTAQSTATLATKEDAIYETDEEYYARLNMGQKFAETYYGALEAGKTKFKFGSQEYDVSTQTGKELAEKALIIAEAESADKSRRLVKAAETDSEFIARKQKLEEKVRKMRAAAEEAIVSESYETIVDGEGKTYYEFKFEFDGVTENLKLTGDDLAKAGSIKTIAIEASHYSTSHNVERYDTKTGEMVEIGPITSASQLKQMEEYMNETVSYQKREESKYFKHKAEDEAAGVKNGGGKK